MNTIKGYALIKRKTTTVVTTGKKYDFEGKIVRVMSWANDGSGILCINPQATALATLENCDIERSFKCKVFSNDIIMHPDISDEDALFYRLKVLSRKGGYNDILKRMVIAASLHRGAFCDSVLWAKQ